MANLSNVTGAHMHPKFTPCYSGLGSVGQCTCGTKCIWLEELADAIDHTTQMSLKNIENAMFSSKNGVSE